MSSTLNVAAICESTTNLGPGNRFVIWVQGCCFNCHNCESPDWRPIEDTNIVNPVLLAELIAEYQNIEGITISGGEPFLQADALILLLENLRKQRNDLTVLIFTGYEYKDLISESAKKLSALADVLITGRYVEELNNNKGLRGSTNQEIIFITERMKVHEDYLYNRERTIEFHLRDSEILMVGIKPKE